MLDCEDFDALVRDHDGRCAICKITGSETGHGFLVIDHDPLVGQWAVRGLLCSPCNGRISLNNAESERDAAYLANPWYRPWLALLGIDSDALPSEPPRTAHVRQDSHTWTWTSEGWRCDSRRGPSGTHDWDRLVRRYGPHRLLVA
jgi:hypothetical protein